MVGVTTVPRAPATLDLHAPQQNHLLAALSPEERDRLLPHLRLVTMPLGKALYESGDVQRYVYFPTDSIVSLLYVMESGASAEVSVVGNEGVIGIALCVAVDYRHINLKSAQQLGIRRRCNLKQKFREANFFSP